MLAYLLKSSACRHTPIASEKCGMIRRSMLSHERTKRYYDRFAHKQDRQAFYEDPALDRLIAKAQFGSVARVFELGSGTGRLAEQLLSRHLVEHASYQGVDLSPTMVTLA